MSKNRNPDNLPVSKQNNRDRRNGIVYNNWTIIFLGGSFIIAIIGILISLGVFNKPNIGIKADQRSFAINQFHNKKILWEFLSIKINKGAVGYLQNITEQLIDEDDVVVGTFKAIRYYDRGIYSDIFDHEISTSLQIPVEFVQIGDVQIRLHPGKVYKVRLIYTVSDEYIIHDFITTKRDSLYIGFKNETLKNLENAPYNNTDNYNSGFSVDGY